MAKVGAVGRAVSTDEAQLFSKDLSWKGWLFQGVAYLCPRDPGSPSENGNGIPLDWLGEWLVLIEWLGEWAGYHSRGMSWDGNGFKWNLNTFHFGGCLVHPNHAHPLTRWIDRIPRVKRLVVPNILEPERGHIFLWHVHENMAGICMESLATCYLFPAVLTGSLVLSPVFLEPGWCIDGTEIFIHPFSLKNVEMFHPSCRLWSSIWWSMLLFIQVWDVKSWPIDTAQTFERLGLQHSLMPMFFGPAVSLT